MSGYFSEVWTLTRAGLINAFSLNAFSKKSGAKRGRTVLFIFVILVALVPSVFSFFWILADGLEAAGALYLLVHMGVVASVLTGLITSSYKAQGFLFDFRDFGLLTSLPLRNGAIFLSKLIQLYVNNLLMLLVVGAPVFVTYGIRAGAGPGYYAPLALLLPFLGVAPMLAGAFLSLLLSRLTSRLKRTGIMPFLALLLVLLVVGGTQLLTRALTASAMSEGPLPDYFAAITRWLPPAGLFISALLRGSILSGLAFIAVNLALAAAFAHFLGGNFKKINAMFSEKASRAGYKIKKAAAVSSVAGALFKRELKFYLSSANYMMNTAIGMLLLLAYALGIMFFGGEAVMQVLSLEGGPGLIFGITVAVTALILAMSCTTAPSVSLEGKSFWLMKSLPVDFRAIALSKIALNLVVTVPAFVLSSAILLLALRMSAAEYALYAATGLCYCLSVPIIGLLMNLRFPKLNWVSQIHAVKQSASVLLAMLVNMATVIIPIAFAFAVSGVIEDWAVILIADAFVLLVAAAAWRLLMSAGARLYKSLS